MTRVHDTDSYDCWCAPKYIDAETGGELTRAEAEWTWDGIVIVHNDPPDVCDSANGRAIANTTRDDRRDHDRHPPRPL